MLSAFLGSVVIMLICILSLKNLFLRRRLSYRKRLVKCRQKRFKAYLKLRKREMQKALNNVVTILGHPLPVERSVWCRKRSEVWWDTIVNDFSDSQWLENFRMRERTFNFICEKLRPYLLKKDTHLRKAISVRKRIAIAIWRLATNSDYRTIGHLFGVSNSSVCLILEEFCSTVKHILLPEFVKIPTGIELDKVVEDFQNKWGFPQCGGAIDGSHIPIKAPTKYYTDYYNRKGWYSIILQAIVDSSYKFIDINVGWPGKVHDARVFSNSSVYEKGNNGSLFSASRSKKINNVDVPIFIIADAAYPLLPWVMKPFKDNGNLAKDKAHFNYRLSRARMVVENAFGRLKGRWRCLLKQNEAELNKMNDVVATCCVLHNICETFKEEFNDDMLQEDFLRPGQPEPAGSNENTTPSANAEAIQNSIMQYCQQNPI